MKLAGWLAAGLVMAALAASALPPATAAPAAKTSAKQAAAKPDPARKKVSRSASSKAAAKGKAPGKAAAARTDRRKAAATAKASSRPASVRATAKSSGRKGGKRPSRATAAAAPGENQRIASKTSLRHEAAGKTAAVTAATGAGLGASAVKASLHESAPEPAGTVSIGEAIGLHRIPDPLALRSAVALVVDSATGEILYDKNSNAVLPIASITKVMMAMVVLDARQPLDQKIAIEDEDRDTERYSASRLPIGTVLSRGELLQLALMSSENRAASALARHYPGGMEAFVAAANRKAAAIGMRDSVFNDGTGLSSSNVSTARDLAVMVAYASRYPLIGRYSTAQELHVRTAHGTRTFRTTNRMVASADWDLSLQKTGYINESGNCLVMRGTLDGRSLILVLLDSFGRYSRMGDAQRIRRWLEG
jgi:serine-type D-Ala-D-Ala endopeptidase (penicillin-binding protein 7)